MSYPVKKLGKLIEKIIKSLVLLFQKNSKDSSKTKAVEPQNAIPDIEGITTISIEKATQKITEKELILQLMKGEAYLADNLIVKKLREVIRDEFGLGKSGDCLNCTEFVQFRIKQKFGIEIKWPLDRPRNGGKWASIFEKNDLYKIFDLPRSNCAVSFTTGISNNPKINEIGHVAFVEKVNNDGSIEISEANWPNQGKYNERRLEKWQWQDKYRCRFIDFS